MASITDNITESQKKLRELKLTKAIEKTTKYDADIEKIEALLDWVFWGIKPKCEII